MDHLPDEPSDICEFRYEEKELFLAGFLRKAQGWYTLTFRDPQICVEYDAEEKQIPHALP
ncbi:hypothetical protein Q0M94_16440 [Deinococcus radiomollis]|uniref:hypothetical protein n=1 Tax=Deinococcus radiomollis TaxID=468916 RepID=UPI003891AB9C